MSGSKALKYTVRLANPAAHLFEVELCVDDPDPEGQEFSLPAWIPGSYLIREFAKNIVQLHAFGTDGPVAIEKLDKDRWRAGAVAGPLTLRYEVYAWDLSVRTAHLDQTHGFFNGTSLFLRVSGRDESPQRVTLLPPTDPRCEGWKVATTLPRVEGDLLDFGVFEASDYDELIDHPVEMGTFTHFSFDVAGVPHEVAITGVHSCDTERLAADLTVICQSHIDMFGELPPMDRYLFQVMAVGSGYGGLEHRSSTALICERDHLPQVGEEKVTDGYRQFLGLCSHEYFHLWNVKRIKPAAFTPYRLNEESYTGLLWAFEGITSYYDDLGLLRAGSIDASSYFELVGRTATRVYSGSGRLKQSLVDSSFDAWTKFYRQDENAPNAIVSYYAKGSLAALAIDLKMQMVTDGARCLDDVMRVLWERHGKPGVGVEEEGIDAIISELCGQDLSGFLNALLRSTEDPPLRELLEHFGVQWMTRPAESGADRGGKKGSLDAEAATKRGDLRVKTKSASGGVGIVQVHDGGAAQLAGLSAGDVIIAVNGLRVQAGGFHKRIAALGAGTKVDVVAFRRDELMRFEATLQAPASDRVFLVWQDGVSDEVAKRRQAWLGIPD